MAVATRASVLDELVSVDERRQLLRWARERIAAGVEGGDPARVDGEALTERLRAPWAAFVTLTIDGELRGCIGSLDFERPLWRNVVDAAEAAAFEDPRFPPLSAGELAGVRLEISILERPRPLEDLTRFDPNLEGIIVTRGLRRGLLLPQVARERHWDARQTLEAVCWKAGLPEDAWLAPGTQLSSFRSWSFEEPPRRPPVSVEAECSSGPDPAEPGARGTLAATRPH